ncbi:MAG TPA: glutamyl-tRNA reductase [Chryseosolibacter sp.]
MARQIFAAEISHEDTPLAIREKLAGSEATIREHLSNLNLQVDEVFVLSTCNRFTIYAVNESINPLTEFFNQYPALKGYTQFYYNTEESVTHLLAVASGLLSPIKGDHEILGQLQLAKKRAHEMNSLGITLDNLLRQAIRIGKRVRTETGIDKFCVSVVDNAIELLYSRLDSMHDKKFLVIGTGKIARMAIKYLYNEGIQNVSIVSKDFVRADELAQQYYMNALHLDDLHEHVKNADVIIGATHYEVSLFPESYLSGFFDVNKVWFILDFGMPRNFNSKLADHSAIELYNLDDLKRIHKSPLDAFGGVESAWSIVMKEAKAFMEVFVQLEFSPVLAAYWNRLLFIRNRELNVLLPRLDQELSACDVEKIRKQANKIIRTISGDVSKSCKVLSNNNRAENGIDSVTTLTPWSTIKFNISLN